MRISTQAQLLLLIAGCFVGAEECEDKSPYCNPNDCSVRPGYAREYCKRTCGNCEDFCENSQFVSCAESRKSECDAMLRDYCPLLCGICRRSRATSRQRAQSYPLPNIRAPTLLSSSTATPLANANMSQVIEQARTGTPYVMPPMFKGNERENGIRRSPKTHTNAIDAEDDDDNMEWLIDSSTPPGPSYMENTWQRPAERNFRQQNGPYIYPELPAPQPVKLPQQSPWKPNVPMGSFYGPFPAFNNMGNTMGPSRTQPHSRRAPQNQYYSSFVTPPYNPMASIYSQGMSFGSPAGMQGLVSLLGCRDRDPATCARVTDETCLSRPGFYLKLCPVKCRNCNGLLCYDSIKVDCDDVRRNGGCRLPAAAEYCPRTCQLCPVPHQLSDSVSTCRDELETCPQLAQSGMCEQPDSKTLLRNYCAKSCGFCRNPQYYNAPHLHRRKEYAKLKKTKKA